MSMEPDKWKRVKAKARTSNNFSFLSPKDDTQLPLKKRKENNCNMNLKNTDC